MFRLITKIPLIKLLIEIQSLETLFTKTDQEHKLSMLMVINTTNKELLDQLLTNKEFKFKFKNKNQFTRPIKLKPDLLSDPETAEQFTNILIMMLKIKDLLEFQPQLSMMFLSTNMSMSLLKNHATHVVVEIIKDSELIKLSMLLMLISTKEVNQSELVEMEEDQVCQTLVKKMILLKEKIGVMFWINSLQNTVKILSLETAISHLLGTLSN